MPSERGPTVSWELADTQLHERFTRETGAAVFLGTGTMVPPFRIEGMPSLHTDWITPLRTEAAWKPLSRKTSGTSKSAAHAFPAFSFEDLSHSSCASSCPEQGNGDAACTKGGFQGTGAGLPQRAATTKVLCFLWCFWCLGRGFRGPGLRPGQLRT